MNLADVIGRWVGRVEIVLAGAEEDLQAGQEALGVGDGIRARAAARRILQRAPGSPLALALLADACDAARLDAELALTLEELARRTPSRAEVWVRLGRARSAIGASVDETREALLRALAVAEAGSDARSEALLALADVDLFQRQGARAELWLARLVRDGPAVVVRRAEAHLLRGDAAGARRLLEPVAWAPTDGRAALALGRAYADLGDSGAFAPLLRALVLDVPGASEALSGALGRLPSDGPTRARIRSIVEAKGELGHARWQAAFAEAEGAREAALLALRAALRSGEASAARALFEASLDDHDREALNEALRALPAEGDRLLSDARALLEVAGSDGGDAAAALDTLARVSHPRAIPWARVLADATVRASVPPQGGPVQWSIVIARLDHHAHELGDRATAGEIAGLASDRFTPVRLAVVGEFNAGKSSFINALVGARVAPTGILPTTAVTHHLRWASGSLAVARILLRSGDAPAERIVAPWELAAALSTLDPKSVDHVEIRMPIAALARVEVLDTPGFNADVVEHQAAAWAALDGADIAFWLVDATQAMKQTERLVLEQASRRGLPVQVLVNKADRLRPEEVDIILQGVRDSLASIGLKSWQPPLPLSSKLALLGKRGDAAALRDSGWEAVQTLIDDGVVAESETLKERSLRRRAARIVKTLRAGCLLRVSGELARSETWAENARQAVDVATHLEQDGEACAARLAAHLEEPARRWGLDLSMVFVGRDANESAVFADPMLARYRTESATAALAPVAIRELLRLAPPAVRPALAAGALSPSVRAVIRTAAGAVSPGTGEAERLVANVCRAALATLVEQLLGYSSAASDVPTSRWEGVSRELDAFAAALQAD